MGFLEYGNFGGGRAVELSLRFGIVGDLMDLLYFGCGGRPCPRSWLVWMPECVPGSSAQDTTCGAVHGARWFECRSIYRVLQLKTRPVASMVSSSEFPRD